MRSGRNPILLGAVILLSVFALWLSGSQILRFVRFGVLPQMAYRLESGEATDRASIMALVPVAEDVRTERLCQTVFVKSGFLVLLAALDLENQDKDYNSWALALERAETFARYALGCAPTNGNFWLRYAMLRQAVGEQPHELSELMTNSQAYAPAEAPVLAGRYALYNRMTDETLALLTQVVTTDMEVICSESGNGVRDKLSAPSLSIDRIVKEVAPQCALPAKAN